MLLELKDEAQTLSQIVKKRGIVFDLVRREDELAELVTQTEDPEFWNDPDAAQAHAADHNRAGHRRAVAGTASHGRGTTLAGLGLEEEDEGVAAEELRGPAPGPRRVRAAPSASDAFGEV